MSLARPDGGVLETDDGEGGDSDDGDELPTIHVGDHVTDRDDADELPLVVTGLPLAQAASYDVDGRPLAEYNPEYPPEDHAIEVAYAQRTDVFLEEQQTYAFPRSRLRLVTPLHDRDERGDQEGDADA
jgi:hypothetical protein